MAEKKETTKLEREYTIPLREKCRPVPTYKKTPKSVKTIKEFLARHMKLRDRDLNKIKLDMYLNEQLWTRGIKKPLHKIKVKVVQEGEIVRVYAADLPAKINFKKIRHEKMKVKAAEAIENKKSMMQKAKESIQPGAKKEETKTEVPVDKDKDKDGIDDKVEIKEKEKSVAPKGVPSSKKAEGKAQDQKEQKVEAKTIKKTTSVKKKIDPVKEDTAKK
jgi:large subunit ribosomal protein L31e